MADIKFTGHTAADAELRHTRKGDPVLNVRVCDSKSRKTDQGTWETLAETWYNVALYGSAAEALVHDIRKGARVEVAGEFYTRPYEGRNGSGVSNDVTATGIRVLPSRGAGQGGVGFGGATPDPRAGTGWGQGSQGAAFDGPNGPTKGADADPWSGGGGGGWDTPAATEPGF